MARHLLTLAMMLSAVAVHTKGLGSSLVASRNSRIAPQEVRDAGEFRGERLVGQLPEPALNQVEPRRARWDEVEVKSRVLGSHS